MIKRLVIGFGVISVILLLFIHRLGDRDLWSSHEARAAMDAQTMLSDGRWDLPRQYDGRLDLQKPPLYYWLIAGLGALQGGRVDAWAVRLPSALAALGIVGGLWFVLLKAGRPVAAVVAAVAVATATHFTWLARTGRIDMPLSLTTMIAVLAFVHARRQESARSAFAANLLGYVALAAGVLLKGPIGFVLPIAVVGSYALVEGDWRPSRWRNLARRWGVWWGLPLTAALALPWFFWANAATEGEFFRVFFWHHNLQRGLGGSDTLEQHPWWFYLPRFAFDFLPWTPFFIIAVWLVVRRGWFRDDPLARLGLVWTAVVVGLLSLVQFKRADYLLPAYPGAALLLGCVGERWFYTLARRRWAVVAFGSVVGAVVLGWLVCVEVVLPWGEARREQRSFAIAIRRHVPEPEPVVLFWTEPHALMFHLGRPLRILIEWDRLEAELDHGTPYVVMPPEIAARSPEHLKRFALDEVVRNSDLAGGWHDKPLALLRARALTPLTGNIHARAADSSPPDRPADQPDPAGPQ